MIGVSLALLSLAALESADLKGYWRNPKGTVIVSIGACGDTLCGVVEWASESAKADARHGGSDPLLGVEVLSGLKSKQPGRWRGTIFAPDLNKRSKAELRQIGPDQLRLTVCAASVLCKSEIWTRTVQP